MNWSPIKVYGDYMTNLSPYHRIMLFIDYWNFKLPLEKKVPRNKQLNFDMMPTIIMQHAENIIKSKKLIPCDCGLEGTHIYMSYHPQRGVSQKTWAERNLGCMVGIYVTLKEQQKRNNPFCVHCKKDVDTCPNCNQPLDLYQEKGIDVAIATDIIRLAWENAFDTAILVSNDKDFIPVVKFIEQKGKKVIHTSFYPAGAELRKECWISFDLADILNKLEFYEKNEELREKE
jgi:uncharacterized LabA/DUF88 family protein